MNNMPEAVKTLKHAPSLRVAPAKTLRKGQVIRFTRDVTDDFYSSSVQETAVLEIADVVLDSDEVTLTAAGSGVGWRDDFNLDAAAEVEILQEAERDSDTCARITQAFADALDEAPGDVLDLEVLAGIAFDMGAVA